MLPNKMKTKFLLLISLLILSGYAQAQDWMKIHRNYSGKDWTIPLQLDKYKQWEFSSDNKKLNAEALLEDFTTRTVPFAIANLDSIEFADELSDEEKGHNKYRPFTMHITTEDCANIVEREVWINCHISIDGKGEYSDYSGTGRIRGRGNSSWEWYDKKPYKFKLDEKSKLLGLDKAKNWNLLANYRDVTDMMNVYAFEAARYMDMPNTNHSRFVEVFLNDDYIGTYQLTEKIEVGKNRVDIDEEEGVMLSFDQDDGPSLSPSATDNFSSSVYGLPMCVKYPEDPDAETVQKAKEDFSVLETAIKSHDFNKVDSLLDIHSFMGILQLHELIYNVEIDAPRSIYMYRDKGGKYVLGPVWDWDAGYDFDWGDMYTGHTFFTDYKELIYGTDPVKGTGASYSINKFWRDMFNDSTFVAKYKEQWADISDSIYLKPWAETYKYVQALTKEGTYDRDSAKWPLTSSSGGGWDWGGWGGWGGQTTTTTFEPSDEIEKMQTWLKNRKSYLDTVIPKYPGGGNTIIPVDPSKDTTIKEPVITQNADGSITVNADISFGAGYSQSYQINLDETMITTALGGSPTSLKGLNTSGSTGSHTAGRTYGAWFDANGDVCNWGSSSHVYIEADDFYTWYYGCHPDSCQEGDTHTVRMQYKYGSKKLIVTVNFTVK